MLTVGDDVYMPAWSAPSPDYIDFCMTGSADQQTHEERTEALEHSVETLKRYGLLSVCVISINCIREIEALEKELAEVRAALEDIDEWKGKISDWGESLMNLLWGAEGQQTATAMEVTKLIGWIEESPV
jgi:hypothetical protein